MGRNKGEFPFWMSEHEEQDFRSVVNVEVVEHADDLGGMGSEPRGGLF